MITIKLDDGRELVLNPVSPHEAMGIAEGCRHLSGVRQWWRMAMIVAAIRSVDGIPLPLPTHEKHIEGMVGRFSRQEMKAVSAALESQPISPDPTDLEFAQLTPLETLRIWAVIGEFETVAGWVTPAFIAATVRKIGNEKVALPASKEDMKALVKRLGLAGMAKASAFILSRSASQKAAELENEAAAKN